MDYTSYYCYLNVDDLLIAVENMWITEKGKVRDDESVTFTDYRMPAGNVFWKRRCLMMAACTMGN